MSVANHLETMRDDRNKHDSVLYLSIFAISQGQSTFLPIQVNLLSQHERHLLTATWPMLSSSTLHHLQTNHYVFPTAPVPCSKIEKRLDNDERCYRHSCGMAVQGDKQQQPHCAGADLLLLDLSNLGLE